MRKFIALTVMSTVIYLMTGLVYSEGGFDGALVMKPHPIPALTFGGGEEGSWERLHPNQAKPWFMHHDLHVIARFSWEEGSPSWVSAYTLGYLAVLLAWCALGAIAIIKAIRFFLNRRNLTNRSRPTPLARP
jgi:hypothetical protein